MDLEEGNSFDLEKLNEDVLFASLPLLIHSPEWPAVFQVGAHAVVFRFLLRVLIAPRLGCDFTEGAIRLFHHANGPRISLLRWIVWRWNGNRQIPTDDMRGLKSLAWWIFASVWWWNADRGINRSFCLMAKHFVLESNHLESDYKTTEDHTYLSTDLRALCFSRDQWRSWILTHHQVPQELCDMLPESQWVYVSKQGASRSRWDWIILLREFDPLRYSVGSWLKGQNPLLFARPTHDPSIFMVPNARRSRLCLLPSVRDLRWLKILNLQDRSANTKCDQCCGRLGSLIFEPKDYGAKFEYQKIATFSNKWQNWFTYLVPENFGGPSQVGVLSGKGCDMKIPAAAKVLALNHRVNSQAWPCGLQCQCTFCLRDDVQYYATRF